MALQRVQQSGIPTVIGGDFNMDVAALPAWECLRALGYVEAFQFAADRLARTLPATCRHSTKNDNVLIPPFLQPLLQRADVLTEAHLFDSHAPLLLTFSVPYAYPAVLHWKLPRTWANLQPKQADVAAAYASHQPLVLQQVCSCTTTIQLQAALQHWAQCVEWSVDTALAAAHQQVGVKPPNGGGSVSRKRFATDAKVRQSAQHRKKLAHFRLQWNAKHAGMSQGFAAIKPVPHPPFSAIPVVERRDIQVTEVVDPQHAWASVQLPQFLRHFMTCQTAAGHMYITDQRQVESGSFEILLRHDNLQLLPEQTLHLEQHSCASSPDELHREFYEYWSAIWNRDKGRRRTCEDSWADALADLPPLPDHAAPLCIADFDLEAWQKALQGMRPNKALPHEYVPWATNRHFRNALSALGFGNGTNDFAPLDHVAAMEHPRLLRYMGLPDCLLHLWFDFLSKMERAPSFNGSIGTGLASTTGVPEGDPLSVVAMIGICWLVTQRTATAQGYTLTFVDNPSWVAYDQPTLERTLANAIKFCADWALPVDWLLPPDAELVRVDSAKDLEISYRGGVWPQALYGQEAQLMPLGKVEKLRAAAARAVWGKARSLSVALAMAVGYGGTQDPEMYLLHQAVVAMQRLLRIWPDLGQRALQLTRDFQEQSGRPFGPATTLARLLNRNDWTLQSTSAIKGPGLEQIDLS
ncbi:unnamed protein product, partial [Symbiodinium pilosum]